MRQTSSTELEQDFAKLSTADAIHVDSISKLSPYGPLFSKLPLELIFQIWYEVLVSHTPVDNAHIYMSPQEPLMVASYESHKDIDSSLLRTCRAIYAETLPILYGSNTFAFKNPSEIRTFAFGNLHSNSGRHFPSDPFGLRLKQNGRLTMLRYVALALINPIPLSSTETRHSIHALEAAWSVWADFFQPSSEQQSLTFPALEELTLGFAHWELDDSEISKLRVEPFIRRLRPSGGLRRLVLYGIFHEQNLNDFKHGFVKEGGEFEAIDKSNNYVANDILVSNSNLDTVSKGVRDILQRDGVSALVR